MELPEYVTVEEVKRVCGELKIRDWTTLKEAEVLPEEAGTILAEVAELEGDLLKALVAKDLAKVKRLYKELAEAKLVLSQAESDQLASE